MTNRMPGRAGGVTIRIAAPPPAPTRTEPVSADPVMFAGQRWVRVEGQVRAMSPRRDRQPLSQSNEESVFRGRRELPALNGSDVIERYRPRRTFTVIRPGEPGAL